MKWVRFRIGAFGPAVVCSVHLNLKRPRARAVLSGPRPAGRSLANGRPSRPRIPRSAWARIRLFAMDVDGVLTDGTVAIASDGTEAKTFSILDGLGLVRCRGAGIILAWISGRASPATTVRATELQIPHLIQGCTNKLAALQQLARHLGLAPSIASSYRTSTMDDWGC